MRLKFVLNMEHFQRQWAFVLSLLNIGQQQFSSVSYVKEKDLSVDQHRGKMWKQVISEKVQDDKKNDIQELKQKTDKIEEKIQDLEKKLQQRTEEIEEKIDGLEKKLIQRTDKMVENLEEKLMKGFEEKLKERTVRLEGLVRDRDVDMAVIVKHYEERTEAETKKDRKLKKIEENCELLVKQYKKRTEGETKKDKKIKKIEQKVAEIEQNVAGIGQNVAEILNLLRARPLESENNQRSSDSGSVAPRIPGSIII